MDPRGRTINLMLKIAVATLLCLWYSAATASDYKCVVRHAYTISGDGGLRTDPTNVFLGGEFAIDRATGRMIGILTNHNANGEPWVIDPGTRDRSFKVITVYKPIISVDYLQVQEFADQPAKPFFFLKGIFAMVVSGQCTYFYPPLGVRPP